MKRLLLLALFIIPLEASAQVLEGFLNIPFKVKQDSVIKVIKQKYNASPSKKSVKDILYFNNISVAGQHANEVIFQFIEEEFYCAYAIFIPEKEPEITTIYNDIKDKINLKYFRAQNDIDSYIYPYEKGDGHMLTALKTGKAKIGTVWMFDQHNKVAPSKISLLMSSDMYVLLGYEDGILSAVAKQKETQKNIKDL